MPQLRNQIMTREQKAVHESYKNCNLAWLEALRNFDLSRTETERKHTLKTLNDHKKDLDNAFKQLLDLSGLVLFENGAIFHKNQLNR